MMTVPSTTAIFTTRHTIGGALVLLVLGIYILFLRPADFKPVTNTRIVVAPLTTVSISPAGEISTSTPPSLPTASPLMRAPEPAALFPTDGDDFPSNPTYDMLESKHPIMKSHTAKLETLLNTHKTSVEASGQPLNCPPTETTRFTRGFKVHNFGDTDGAMPTGHVRVWLQSFVDKERTTPQCRGGDVFDFMMTSPSVRLPPLRSIDLENGLYELHFVVPVAGEYTLCVDLRSTQTYKDKPFF
eukprot:PhM_4_TR4303/c0_g1_i1/m.60181